MKKTPVRLGPLALLMTVISICLTILSILTLTTAGADLRMAERYRDSVTVRYELEAEGMEFVNEARNGRLDQASREGDEYIKEFEKEGYTLVVGITDDNEISTWKLTKEWSEDTDINVWDGN